VIYLVFESVIHWVIHKMIHKVITITSIRFASNGVFQRFSEE
jgi:hypothetical protein